MKEEIISYEGKRDKYHKFIRIKHNFEIKLKEMFYFNLSKDMVFFSKCYNLITLNIIENINLFNREIKELLK